jgi:hypothetical protein
MRKAFVFFVLFTLILISCKKSYKYYGFNLDRTIELNLEKGDADYFDPVTNVMTNSEQIFENKGTSVELVDSIFLETIEIPDSCFNHISRIELYVLDENSDTLNIAWAEDSFAPNLNGAVSLIIEEKEADHYIKASEYDLITKGYLKHTMNYPTVISIYMRFKVHSTVK